MKFQKIILKLVLNIRMDENIQTYSLEDAFMLLEKDLDY